MAKEIDPTSVYTYFCFTKWRYPYRMLKKVFLPLFILFLKSHQINK